MNTTQRAVQVAAVQMRCSWDLGANLALAEELVRAAASDGAQIVLLPELFQCPYFCAVQDPQYFELAEPLGSSAVVQRFCSLAGELRVVLPISWFERSGPHYFNSLAVADADGSLLGTYRKTHIPDGPGYQEKFYFTPGDTGFRSFATRYATIGCGICWDQWFPESARAMMLQGAELLFYPTAIGSEPAAPEDDTRDGWQRAMQGHATSNAVPVIAANRHGRELIPAVGVPFTEVSEESAVDSPLFYGSSFLTDETGAKVAEATRSGDGVLHASYDLEALTSNRATWGFFRDRRAEAYGVLVGE